MLNKKPLILIIIFTVVLVGFIFYFGKIQNGVSLLWSLAFNKSIELKKNDGSINILLLGIGGGKHDGPDLSDTIIFANIQPSKNEINLISIPRDLWVPSIKAKINSAYATGQEKDKKGILLSSAVIEKILGKEVDYTVVMDFSGFIKLVDLLGGVDVEIARTFDDYAYPIEGKEQDLCGRKEEEIEFLATSSAELEAFPCRYEHIRFDKGVQRLDGEAALKFVRSRHALGIEGTDFARSQRQHAVISAVKSKTLSLGTIANPVKVIGIYNVLKDNINTNINTDEIDDFVRLAQNMKDIKINNYVLDMGNEDEKRYGLLTNPEVTDATGGQWVLAPRIGNGDFSEIYTFVDCIVEGKKCEVVVNGIEEIQEEVVKNDTINR